MVSKVVKKLVKKTRVVSKTCAQIGEKSKIPKIPHPYFDRPSAIVCKRKWKKSATSFSCPCPCHQSYGRLITLLAVPVPYCAYLPTVYKFTFTYLIIKARGAGYLVIFAHLCTNF